MKFQPWIKYFGKALFAFVLLNQYTQAKILFLPIEQLVQNSEIIVVAKVLTEVGRDGTIPDMTIRREDLRASVVKNELQVIELIKGSLSLEKPFVLNTLKFNGWMEDNVELPPKGSNILLFLVKNEKGEYKTVKGVKKGKYRTVNGIQGVWLMRNGEPFNRTTLKQIKDMVQNQRDQAEKSCNSKELVSLVDAADMQTQAGQYKKAMESYRKAYLICPMKDLEEQMAWLLSKIEDR